MGRSMRSIMMFVAVLIVCALFSGHVYATSLWSGKTIKGSSLFADAEGPDLAINDIVVIIIEEKVTAKTDADTEAGLEDTLSGEVSNWFSVENAANLLNFLKFDFEDTEVKSHRNASTGLPKWGITLKNSFEGEGETTRNNTVVATIAARVVGMEPNGNIVLEGKKNISVNSERTTLGVTGIARKKDVTDDNTIDSSKMLDLNFSVDGKGVVDGVNRRGLISYLLSWIR